MTFRPNEQGFAAVDRAVAEFGHAVAERIADVSRENVAVLTGETRDSIEVVDVAGGSVVRVGGAGVYLELGTADMPAQPFLQPSADHVTTEIPELARHQLGAR